MTDADNRKQLMSWAQNLNTQAKRYHALHITATADAARYAKERDRCQDGAFLLMEQAEGLFNDEAAK